jgi:uncharacterized protein
MAQLERLSECYRFEVEGRRFVYDVNRMMILEVDDAIWDYYEAAADDGINSPEAEVARIHGADVARAVVDDLRQAGLLVSVAALPVLQEPPPPPPGFSGVTLNVTHGCNLKCTYCFAKQGDYGLGESRMSADTARKAVDWLSEHSAGESSARVHFFGGEPLMNMPAIEGAIAHAEERLGAEGKQVQYHVTTNGTLLNEHNVRALADVKNLDVQVSLDGVAAVNDQFRIFASGRGSHDVVAEGIGRLKSATGKVILRGTIPPGLGEFSESLLHFVDDLGATTAAFEPMFGSTLRGQTLQQEDLETIKAEWTKVAEYFIEHVKHGEIKPVSNLVRILIQLHKRKKTVYGCTAGWSQVAVVPSGDIYPCHRFVGESDWKMGNIHQEGLDESIRARFAENTVDNREPCKSCWARYTCGGRCAHEAKEATGKISEPDPVLCDLTRHLTDLALKIYVRTEPHQRDLLEGVKRA